MAEQALHVLRVAQPYDALSLEVLKGLEREALPAFLMGRRWFGGKGAPPKRVRIGAIVPVTWEAGRAVVVRLDVELGDGGTARYQLPLAVVNGVGEDVAPIARVESEGGGGLLVDASGDASFRRMLAESFAAGGRVFESGRSRLTIEPVDGCEDAMRNAEAGTVGSAEQSNTSIVYGDAAILKLFRRLEAGESPDVELTRALTVDAGFRHTPALLGTLTLEADGERLVAGMLQRFARGSRDAWRWLLEAGRDGGSSLGSLTPEVLRLGEVTREMHDALAGARGKAMSAETAREGDVRRWSESTAKMSRAALGLLDRGVTSLPRDVQRSARETLSHRDAILRRIERTVSRIGGDAGRLVRHHGDYHLGQVLRTQDGDFFIIDFEGEPARPLAERRQRHSALRDVAGMLRSFGYAAAVLETGSSGRSGGPRWEAEARVAFLRGYFAAGRPDYLPRSRRNAGALLALFETEKVLYELAYELNNRPDWVWIPLRGLAAARA